MLPLLVPALLGGLASVMGSLVGRAIIALGIGYVTYKGLDVAVGSMKDLVIANVRGLPSQALAFVSYLYVDKALSMIMSAVVISLSLRLLGGGVKKLVHK
jgi:hypothetical protein